MSRRGGLVGMACLAMAVLSVCMLPLRASAGSQLIVMTPSDLAANFTKLHPPVGDIPDAAAMFGVPFYGTSLTATVVYSNPPLGCGAIDTSNFPDPSLGMLVVLLIDRGNCTFVAKVRNAQAAGAVAAIIANNDASTSLPLMADDGTALSNPVTTPSMLITRMDAQLIKNTLASGNLVQLAMSFSLPNPDNHVEWEYWTSSNDPKSHAWKHAFYKAVNLLNDAHDHSDFTPHYWILDGRNYGCTKNNVCHKQCTNGGRYCAQDPEGNLNVGLDGEDVIMENLRQMCVYQYLNSTGQNLLWWTYVNIFTDTCGASDATWNATCSDAILKQLNLPFQQIEACITNSGGFTDNENTLLSAERDLRITRGVYFLPTLIINNEIYLGQFDCPEPMKLSTCGPLAAICSGFMPGSRPEACDGTCDVGVQPDACGVCGGSGMFDACGQCLPPTSPSFNQSCAGCDGKPWSNATRDACGRCLDKADPTRVTDPDECLGHTAAASKGVSIPVVIGISLAGLVLLGGVVFCYIRRSKARMEQDVHNLLRQYVPLDPNLAPGGGRAAAQPLVGGDGKERGELLKAENSQVRSDTGLPPPSVEDM